MQFSTLFALFSNMRKSWILSVVLLLAGFMQEAKAQGQVVVEVEPSVKEMEETRTALRKANSDKVRGYRILIGFFSSKAEAEALKEQALEPFGGKYGVTVIYDEPNFKVYVGQFTLSDDADVALVEIRRKFSGATRISDIIRRPVK
ncbi:MAG: SPOR domain-containing protein [Bacteroidetes bacterium]|nr:SPOR domain-containing protein [Bacteroidota bacterium]